MKKRMLTIGIISLVLILSAGYFLAGTVLEMDRVIESKLMQATSGNSKDQLIVSTSSDEMLVQRKGQETCYSDSNYFVVSQLLTDQVGSNTLVKYKKGPEEQFPCKYVVENGDFEIKNVGADYYEALVNHYIVMDSGTSPGIRGIFIYDLNTKLKVYEATKVGSISDIGKNVVTYDELLNEDPTLQNCPKMDEYYRTVGNAVMVSKTTLTFGNSVKKETVGENQCRGIN